MTTANDILNFIHTLAPKYMAEDWDNVGLLCGSAGQEVNRVLIALDPFLHVCEEAVQWNADLLLTHHPIIFSGLKSLTDDDETGKCLRKLIRNNIAAINAHTNLDMAPGGVNDVLAARLGLQDVTIISPEGTTESGTPYGLLRMGNTNEMSLEQFLRHVKSALGTPTLRFCDGGKPIRKVAVGGGACGGGYAEAARAGCDAFVTSDVKYNQFWEAQSLGLSLIDAGHFYTENPVCSILAEKLAAQFPDLEIKISASHSDCMKFY